MSEENRRGYSGSGAALATVGSSQRGLHKLSTRQHFEHEDNFDCESARGGVDNRRCRTGTEDVWAGHASYKMRSAARGGAWDTTRQSDEVHIVSASDTRGELSPSSLENTDTELGITKQVDIQVESYRSSQHGQWRINS
jgi:hypothetical protein